MKSSVTKPAAAVEQCQVKSRKAKLLAATEKKKTKQIMREMHDTGDE